MYASSQSISITNPGIPGTIGDGIGVRLTITLLSVQFSQDYLLFVHKLTVSARFLSVYV